MYRIALVLALVCWMGLERTIRLRRSNGGGVSRDAGTLCFLRWAIYGSVPSALAIAFWHSRGFDFGAGRPWQWVGLGMIAAGLAIRGSALRTLRRFFTPDVTIVAGQRLIQTGLYRFVRHPGYAGMLLSIGGLAVALANGYAAALLATAPTLAVWRRIRVEERVLRQAFPDDYPRYCRTTARLIPFVF